MATYKIVYDNGKSVPYPVYRQALESVKRLSVYGKITLVRMIGGSPVGHQSYKDGQLYTSGGRYEGRS